MSMFDNYDNLSANYVPDNTSPKPSDEYFTLADDALPRPAFNIKGNFIGYTWTAGDTFDMKFSVKDIVKVDKNSIIYYNTGVCPTTETMGSPGQQAYNVPDTKSWTCVKFDDGLYIWVEDDVITYLADGEVELDFTPSMEGKTLQLDVYNFRWEHFHTFSSLGAAEIVCTLDKDITEKFKPGVYYSTLKVLGDSTSVLHDTYMFIVK